MGEGAKRDRAIADGTGVSVLGEAHGLADQRLTDIDCVTVPLDLPVLTHAPDDLVGPVARFAQDAVEAARRESIMLGRSIVAERLMRAFLIVDVLEHAQALQLLAQAASRRFGGVLQQSEMHSVMSAILLWLSRGAPPPRDRRPAHL